MGSKIKVAQIPSFVGGLNVFNNATQVKENESADLLNISFKGLTAITKRRGYIKHSAEITAGKRIQGLFSYITNTVREKLFVCDGKLYRHGTPSAEITGGTFTSDNVNAIQVGDRLYLFDGTTALSYYNGSNIVTTGITAAPTKVSQSIFFNNRIYCASNDQKSRVYFAKPLTSTGAATDSGDFTTGNTAGFVDYGLGKEVVGFAKTSSILYVFLKDGIRTLNPTVNEGVLDHTQSIISNSVGCRSPRSIENVSNDIYFMNDTIYSLGEVANYATIRTTNVSARVSKLFSGMTQSAIKNVACIYYDKEETFLVSFQSGSSCNDHILAYQIPYKSWTYWDNIYANSFLDWIDDDDIKHLYFGSDSTSSYVYELYQGLNDDGSAFDCFYKTKEFDLKSFNIEKIFQNWNIQLGGTYGITTVRLYVNGVVQDEVPFSSGSGAITSDGLGTSPLGTFVLGLEGNYADATSSDTSVSNDWRWHTLVTSPTGTTFQLEFRNDNLNESFEIKQANVGHLELPYYKRSAEKEV